MWLKDRGQYNPHNEQDRLVIPLFTVDGTIGRKEQHSVALYTIQDQFRVLKLLKMVL